MTDVTTDVKDGQNDPLADAKTPQQALRILNDLRMEKAELLSNAEVGRGTGEAETWTTADNDRLFALKHRLEAANASWEQRFAGYDALMNTADVIAAGGYITPDGEPVMPTEHAVVQPSSRLMLAQAFIDKQRNGDGTPLDMALTRQFGDALMNATSIATVAGTSAGNVALPTPVTEWWPRPGESEVHFNIIPKIRWPNYAYTAFLQTARVTQAADVAQNNPAAEGIFSYAEERRSMRRYAVHVPYTEELMMDAAGVEQMIFEDVRRDVAEKVSIGVLRGTGPNAIAGLANVTAATYAAGVPAPNDRDWTVGASGLTNITSDHIQDLIRQVALAMGEVGSNGRAAADNITMSYDTWSRYISVQDDEGRPIFDALRPGPMMMYGIPVRPSTEFAAPADDGLAVTVGAWRFARLYYWGDVELKVGLNGTDLVNGRQTVVGTLHTDAIFGRPEAFARINYDAS